MRGRVALSVLAPLALASAFGGTARAVAPPQNGIPSAEAIFARAKAAWYARRAAPFVEYGLLERYTWRDRVHDNWWHADYRASDHALALQRIAVAAQDEQRVHGMAFGLHLSTHWGAAQADTLETNPNADAFPVLDPQVDPDASFGLLARTPPAKLVGDPLLYGRASSSIATAPPTPEATASPHLQAQPALRTLVTVEAVARDYAIALAGIERIRSADAYHLVLTPLRKPQVYRLRDLWIDTSDYQTLKLAVEGLFQGQPYDDARWTVSYVDFNGQPYVQQIKTTDTLRFGMDRFVSGLEYDFVQYAFPSSIPPIVFSRIF